MCLNFKIMTLKKNLTYKFEEKNLGGPIFFNSTTSLEYISFNHITRITSHILTWLACLSLAQLSPSLFPHMSLQILFSKSFVTNKQAPNNITILIELLIISKNLIIDFLQSFLIQPHHLLVQHFKVRILTKPFFVSSRNFRVKE